MMRRFIEACALLALLVMGCATPKPIKPSYVEVIRVSQSDRELMLDVDAERGCSGGIRKCRTACLEQEHHTACVGMAMAYHRGSGVMRDADAVFAYEARACALGSATGCRYFANTLTQEHDYRAAAVNLYDRACRAGDEKACEIRLRRALGGRPGDPEAWASLARVAGTFCTEFHRASECELVGDIKRLGLAGQRDAGRAKMFYDLACQYAGNDAQRCFASHGHYGLSVYDYLPARLHPTPALRMAYANWRLGAESSRARPRIQVALCVTAFGSTHDVRIVTSSGDERVDEGVLAMLREAEFPPIRLIDDPRQVVGCMRDVWFNVGAP